MPVVVLLLRVRVQVTLNARVAYVGSKTKLRECHGKVVKKLRAGLVRVHFDGKSVGSKVLHKGQLRVVPLVRCWLYCYISSCCRLV